METLKQLLTRIQQQLSLMTRSQQVAIGLCAVIIMGSLLWLTQWSTKTELEPLLDQPMSVQEMADVVASLDAAGVEYEERGDRVYVRPEERRKLQGQLLSQGALPQDTSLGFENLLKEQSPFQPESVNKRNFIIALQNELAAVIVSDPNVASATVFINDSAQRKIGAMRNIEPTASVRVATIRGKQLDQGAVQAVADLVSGAVAALQPHNVNVIVNGRPRSIPSPEDEISFGLLDETKKREKHLQEKIYAQLSYIPGVKVAVTAELETTRRHVETRDYTQPELKMSKTTDEKSSSNAAGGEAGVNPNTGTALDSSGSGQSTSKEDTTEENYPPALALIETQDHMPFTVKGVTASVNIPRSYFASVYKAQNGDAAEPADADLKTLIEIEQLRVRAHVKKVLGTDSDDAVQVDWFPDLAPDTPGSFAGPEAYALGPVEEEQGTVAKVAGYAPQFGMMGLALASLIMMVMLARKSGRAVPHLPTPEFKSSEEHEELTRPLENASLTEGFLVGQEVDEESLRVSQLREQVSKLVDDDPEGTADLIRRWVEQE